MRLNDARQAQGAPKVAYLPEVHAIMGGKHVKQQMAAGWEEGDKTFDVMRHIESGDFNGSDNLNQVVVRQLKQGEKRFLRWIRGRVGDGS